MGATTGHLKLNEFLRAKRAAVSPEEAGLESAGRFRRVPGLRREEVAQLAGVSVDYYTRLEQGRVQHASEGVLAGIGRALMLDMAEREYLHSLVKAPARDIQQFEERSVSPGTQLLLDSMDYVPAVVLGRCMDVLAWNALGAALFVDFDQVEPERRNLARMVFLDPRVRSLYLDWEDVASSFVAQLRMDALRYADSPRLDALVRELCHADADFRRWWHLHDVQAVTSGRKRVKHPVAGELTLDWQALQIASAPDQAIVVHMAPRDSDTWRGFERLAAWHGARGQGEGAAGGAA
ncbi:helix-turn-helix transcriptional regulator [Streptomyces sp. NPDC017941]|uniref:helix-turn-helix transcriptional regulator n=1 Tax=unclassified Streptomyces TaxID=2593676 RepID=UPI0037B36032